MKEKLSVHKSNINTAAEQIGYSSIGVYDFPDNRFDTVALLDIIKIIEKEKDEFRPEVIFTHHGGDLNIDHQITSKAVITACRPRLNNSVNLILFFEILSSTEWNISSKKQSFRPNWFEDISEYINIKILE